MKGINSFLSMLALSLLMAELAISSPCHESLSNLGKAIRSEPLLSQKSSEISKLDQDELSVKGEDFNQLIREVQEECRDLGMSMIPKAAEYAFGNKIPNKCMRQFVPFFTNLFNPENHRFEEKRTES